MKSAKWILAGFMVVTGTIIVLVSALGWANERILEAGSWAAQQNQERYQSMDIKPSNYDLIANQTMRFDTRGASFKWEVFPKKPVSLRVRLADGTHWRPQGADALGWMSFGVYHLELPPAHLIRFVEFRSNEDVEIIFVSRYAERVL